MSKDSHVDFCCLFDFLLLFNALYKKYTPSMINGMLRNWPMSRGSDFSKLSCSFLINSSKNLAEKTVVRKMPKSCPSGSEDLYFLYRKNK